jgi:hypothetical protein
MARLAEVSTCKITNEPEEQALTCGFTVERARESKPHYQLGNLRRPGLSHGLTCGTRCPRVIVRDRSSPTLMAR